MNDVNGKVTTYAWADDSQLAAVELPNGGGSVTNTYNGDGLRFSRTDANGTGSFLWNGKVLEATLGANNTMSTWYTQGMGDGGRAGVGSRGMGAYGDIVSTRDAVAGVSSLQLYDASGNVIQTTDSGGNITATIAYDAFGNVADNSGPANPTIAWQGKQGYQFEPTLGLQYVRQRWYDPATRQFISPDPLGFGGGDANLFRYAGNNPVNRNDPGGEDAATEALDGSTTQQLVQSFRDIGVTPDSGIRMQGLGPFTFGQYEFILEQRYNWPQQHGGQFFFELPKPERQQLVLKWASEARAAAPPNSVHAPQTYAAFGMKLPVNDPYHNPSALRARLAAIAQAEESGNLVLANQLEEQLYQRPAITGEPHVHVPWPIGSSPVGPLIHSLEQANAEAWIRHIHHSQIDTRWAIIHAAQLGITISGILRPSAAVLRGVPRFRVHVRTHRLAAWAEREVADQIDRLPNEHVVAWGGPIGAHGADAISVNRLTGRVTLWDAKYRSGAVSLRMSRTFTETGRRNSAIARAIKALNTDHTLPKKIRNKAIANISNERIRIIIARRSRNQK